MYESSLAITPPSLQRSPGSGTTEPRPSGPVEPPGLGKLYADYARFVAWFASRLLTRQDEVEDVVQEVFLIAARHLDNLTDPPKVRGWLKTVTLRRASRVLRWKRVRARLGIANRSEGSDQWLASPEASPEDRAVLLELLATLERLPTDLRIAWTLRHLHEESLESVAELAGCSLATAKRRIAAAEVRLRKELQDD